MKKLIAASLVAAAILAGQVQAQTTVVFYSFNTNGFGGVIGSTAMTNYITTASIGSAISSFTNFNSGSTALSILSSVTGSPNNHGFPAGNSVSQNDWTGNASYFQFTLDSTGYQGLILAWAGNVSTTGPTNMMLEYSSTGVGGTFTTFATLATPSSSSVTEDVSSVSALDNNPNDVFRLVGINVGAAAGTAKIDNFSIDALTVIPEPSTIALIGMGMLGLLAVRRRRS